MVLSCERNLIMHQYRDRDWLYHEYVVLEKSLREIGRECGTCQSVILHWIQKYNIPTRTNSESITGEKHRMYGKTHSDETRTKMRAARARQIFSEATKAKISAAAMKRWGDPEYRASYSGKNSHNWKGGKSFGFYGAEFNNGLKEQIRNRDGYICQRCYQTEEQLGCVLSIHHIDYDKENNNSENLISLCRSCHAPTNYSREDWIEHFKKIMENNKDE